MTKPPTSIDEKRAQLKGSIQKMETVLRAASAELESLPEDMVERLDQRLSEWSTTVMSTLVKVRKS